MREKDLKGKKVLFFSPAFFNYESKIADKMREMGAYVDMYDVRSVKGAFERALLKISPDIFRNKSLKYYEDILQKNINKNYDYILIVKCDMTPISILKRFRSVFPNAKICLNLWDSVDNIPGVKEKFKYFDTLHSFDPEDCKKYKELKLRPLFYADEFKKPYDNNNNYKYDISFLGTVHSDRYSVIKDVKRIAKENKLRCYWFLYLQSHFIYYYYKITKKEFRNTNRDMFSFEKMSSEDISKIVDSTRIILDIQHPKQTGLTMRTIEMIGMNKKLITTNSTIKDYDFYNPNNIAVIDRKNIKLDMGFLKKDFEALSKEIYDKYSLESWILEVLE